MGIEGRFQEYAESYLQGKQHRVTADIPIQNISHTPIAVMYGDADRVCPMDSVEWMMSCVGHMVYGNYQFGGYNHSDFGKANDSVFMSELHEALSHLQPHDHHITQEEEFAEDLSRALEEEHEHQHDEDYEHEREVQLAYEFDHQETGHHHEAEDQASWRDDKYHDHSGFDLVSHHYESDHHGMQHQEEDEVEHFDNERLHQSVLGKKGYSSYLQ